MYDQKKTRPEGRVPSGKQRSHWKGVLDLRQNQLVSRISAIAEERVPAKMVRNMSVMTRLWRAGSEPSGTGLLRPMRWRKRWRRMDVAISCNVILSSMEDGIFEDMCCVVYALLY
ncbi:hypothetical protein ACH5RR_027312 [Cinchona calisaya]|uniref:Uncharacterized protein n=1 Tax=Cinchona calisaya TaxID=153742 RepID=A0ABD2Z552_9GENT